MVRPEHATGSGPLLLGAGWFPDQPGGLNRYLRGLYEEMEVAGMSPHAVVLGPAVDPPPGVTIAADARSPLVRRVLAYTRAAARVGSDAPVVDAHFALYSLLPILLTRLRTRSLVVHFQGPWADESRAAGERSPLAVLAKRQIEKAVYRRAGSVVTLSGSFKRLLVERYRVPPWRVTVVPPGVDLVHFSPGSPTEARAALGLPAGGWSAVAVRRLIPRMGLDVLLRAWARAGLDDDARLIVAGDGPDRERLEVEARRLDIEHAVSFLGAVSEDELVACYRAADVCVVPSVELEGFGLVVLEALACGTPAIATDAGGLPGTLRVLADDLVVPAGDEAALAGRLRAAADGTAPLPAAQQCRAHAEQFSWSRALEQHQPLYASTEDDRRRKLRVIYLDHSAALAGGELALLRMLPALGNVDAHVILAEDGPLAERLAQAGLSVEVLPLHEAVRGLQRHQVRWSIPLRSLWRTLVYTARLASLLRRYRPELVHTNSLKSALYGGFAAKLSGTPVVWHVRDRIADDYLPGGATRLVRLLARRLPDAIVANSRTTLATLPQVPVPVAVVPSPVRPELLAAPANRGRATAGLQVGMIGRLAPWKGQHLFLEAFSRAFPEGVSAVVVGAPLFGEDEYEHELRLLAERLGIANRVEFTGFREDVGNVLERLSIMVHASTLPEPMGQVVVEAMAAGVPVVAARAGGPAELIEDGVTGLLYEPGNVQDLAGCMRRLAADSELRERLAKGARKRARDFVPERAAKAVEDLYTEVLGRL